MRIRYMAPWCVLVSLWVAGCGADTEAEGTVLDQLLAHRWFSQTPGFAAAPWFSRCNRVQPGFDLDDPSYDPLSDPFCTVQHETELFAEDGQVWAVEHYRVLRMGEPDPAAALEPWHHDDGYYCWVRVRLDPEPVPGFPETDVQRIPGTITDAGENCRDSVGIGATVVLTWVRGSREGVFGAVTREDPDDILFDGWYGLPDTALGEPRSPSLMFPYVACEPSPAPSGEGPGYCQPATCRTFSGDDELPVCTWQDLRALPADPDLIDPAWSAAFPEMYDEIFSSD